MQPVACPHWESQAMTPGVVVEKAARFADSPEIREAAVKRHDQEQEPSRGSSAGQMAEPGQSHGAGADPSHRRFRVIHDISVLCPVRTKA